METKAGRKIPQLVGSAMNRNNGAFRILVVDNDSVIATSLAEVLRSSGFSALPFSSPFNALAAAAAEHPDVLITHVQKADISGIELALQLKSLCLDCGVLIISGFSCFGNLIERACRLGFQIALSSRPLDPNTMFGEVRRLVRRNTPSATLIRGVDMFLIAKGFIRFIHCANHDGTFRSVCMNCFVTVSSKRREEELIEPEQRHICESWILETPSLEEKEMQNVSIPDTALG
jgi:CheY-like chemotaxis protein